jgi:hypothetical protein
MLKFVESGTAFGGMSSVNRPSGVDIDPPSTPIVFVVAEPFGVPTLVRTSVASLFREFMNQKPPPTARRMPTIATGMIAQPMTNVFRAIPISSIK